MSAVEPSFFGNLVLLHSIFSPILNVKMQAEFRNGPLLYYFSVFCKLRAINWSYILHSALMCLNPYIKVEYKLIVVLLWLQSTVLFEITLQDYHVVCFYTG